MLTTLSLARRSPVAPCIAALCLSLGCGSAPASAEIRMLAPGDALTAYDEARPPASEVASGLWQSVRVTRDGLSIRTVSALRTSDHESAQGGPEHSWLDFGPGDFKATGEALDLDDDALFGMYLIDGRTGRPLLRDGEFASALPGPTLLRSGWQADVRVDDATWTLRTEHQVQADGRLVPGSLQLHAVDGTGKSSVLVGPALSMVFERQELLWIGDLDGDRQLDVLVRRIHIDGQVEYWLRAAGVIGFALVDGDRPDRGYSSGVEESIVVQRPRQASFPQPPTRFGIAALSISEEDWNAWLQSPSSTATVRYDRTLMLGDEPLRITVESVPRPGDEGTQEDSSTTYYGGGMLLRAHFRGRTQVLADLGWLDGSPLQIQADLVDGVPALQMQYMPHYNNQFTYYWRWSDEGRPRFRRWATYHAQGC